MAARAGAGDESTQSHFTDDPHQSPITQLQQNHPTPLHNGIITHTSSPRRASSLTVNNDLPASPKSPRLVRKSSSIFSEAQISPGRTTPSKSTIRRSVSAQNSPRSAKAQSNPPAEQPCLSASSVANQFFKRELEIHNLKEVESTNTAVIIHDSCYGHRFSRPKTSKANLGLIVERPERIQAAILGLSTAYVRQGERHALGKYPPSPLVPITKHVPFAIQRSKRLTPLDSLPVTNVHGVKWMQELHAMCNNAETNLALGAKELTRIPGSGSTPEKTELHDGDLYLCKDSLDALQGALGGVLDGVDAVFQEPSVLKKAFVCVRPPGHHCSASHPAGFCWLNNIHVGIEYAAQKHGLTHAAIIDFDLHHGDGSQAIAWERNAKALRAPKNAAVARKTSIGYFSLHDINSYPCENGDFEKVRNASVCIENSHGQTIWNTHLLPWKTEAEFWKLYEEYYVTLLSKARTYLQLQTNRFKAMSPTVQPKSAIFISAGFDASEWEGASMQRHKVNVPTSFYARFTADICKLAAEEGTGAHNRVISVLEGGYSDRALTSGVLSHVTGLANATPRDDEAFHTWWNEAALCELESLTKPQSAVVTLPKSRQNLPPTYSTPTQSFVAKVVDTTKIYGKSSGNGELTKSSATPPPPEVEWAVSAHELAKLLVPDNRQVNSYQHDELAAPRVKRDRHSSAATIAVPGSHAERMLTRGRRPKTPATETISANASKVPVSELTLDRRRTISTLVEDKSESSLKGPRDRQKSTSSCRTSTSSNSKPIRSSSSRASSPTSNSNHVALSSEHVDFKNENAKTQLPPHEEINARAVNQSRLSAQEQTADTVSEIDILTKGVKKITLRMPVEKSKNAQPAGRVSTKVARGAKKGPAPRLSTRTNITTPNIHPASMLGELDPAMSLPDTEMRTGPNSVPVSGHVLGGGQTQATIKPGLGAGISSVERSIAGVATVNVFKTRRAVVLPDVGADHDTPASKEVLSTTTINQTMEQSNFINFEPPTSQYVASNVYIKPGPITWLPPNSATPRKSEEVKGLPVFNASSVIPFGTRSSSTPESAQSEETGDAERT